MDYSKQIIEYEYSRTDLHIAQNLLLHPSRTLAKELEARIRVATEYNLIEIRLSSIADSARNSFLVHMINELPLYGDTVLATLD